MGRTAAGRQTWLATDLHSNEQVVVKLLAFSPQMEWQELKLFEREAQVLQSLNHDRIPKYRDYFSIDREAGSGLPWFALVQDYIPGCSLQELLEKGQRFSQEQVQKITIQILNILIYLHQLSPPVLHRDIKPSNLILGKDKNIYLVDFGAVQAQSHLTGVTFTVVGTSGYAPLEQFWGRAVAASDLYALGATLIHLLTGTPPADLPQKNSRIQFSDRVSLDPSFVSWIEKMTEISLEERFPTAQEALEVLISGKIRHTSDTKGSSLRKISQPDYSGIQLQKSSDHIKIKYPGFVIKHSIKLIVFCFLFLISLIISFNFVLFYFVEKFVIIFSILFFLWVVFEDRISSDNEDILINVNQKLLIIRRPASIINHPKPIKISENTKIFIKQQGSPYQLMIRCDNRSYCLRGGFQEEECIWLAQEIQNWLNSQQV